MRLSVFRSLLLATVLALPVEAVPSLAEARDSPASFADLAQTLLPAVVNISSIQTEHAGNDGGPDLPGFPPGSPFEQFFKDFMEHNRRAQGGQPGQEPPARRSQSLGSGFIIDKAGLVVTNNHVIEGADEVTVILQDNTTLKAEVVGKDERTDLAVLRVHSDKPLPAAVSFGDSDKERVGDWVLAIGNPFGLGGSVTAGIVSARGRDIRQGPYDDFIQTDAAINRGNSGGPLFNMNGEVIGINTAIYSPSGGGSVGIGFAIPANMARTVVAQLRDFGHARRGWLGVRIQQITPDIAESLGLHNNEGALVAGVNSNGPADKANLRNGDVILKFNGQDVKEVRNLPRIVAETPIGQAVPVLLWREGKEQTIPISIAEMPNEAIQQASAEGSGHHRTTEVQGQNLAGLGLTIAPITDDLRSRYQLSADQKGVVVTQAKGTAVQRGIKPGDVIVEVQQEAVGTPTDVQARIEALRKQNRKSALLLLQTGDGMRWVPLPLADSAKAG